MGKEKMNAFLREKLNGVLDAKELLCIFCRVCQHRKHDFSTL